MTITLTDVNEHGPEFTADEYHAQFTVAASPDELSNGHTGIYELGGSINRLNQVIFTATAVDRDHGRNGQVAYSIVEGECCCTVEATVKTCHD